LGFKPIKLKIYENIDEEKSLELEKNLIKLIGKKNLTNMTDGGEKCVHWDDLDSNTKIKLRKQRSDKMIGDKNPMKNKETSIKISNSLKGIIRTDEYKKEMSEKIKNSKKHKNGTGSLKNREIHRKYQEKNMKPVIQYDKNMNYINEFPSICETARQTGMKKGDIYSVVHCKQKSTHGFIFIFKNKISEK